MIKNILKSLGRFISLLLLGMVISLIASSLLDIHYFFVRLRYTSGVDSLKSWLIGGLMIGVLVGAISSVLVLKRSLQPKTFQLISLVFLRFLIIALSVDAISLTIWNYYKFDYFRLKDAGPMAIAVGLILGLWDLSSHISSHFNKQPS